MKVIQVIIGRKKEAWPELKRWTTEIGAIVALVQEPYVRNNGEPPEWCSGVKIMYDRSRKGTGPMRAAVYLFDSRIEAMVNNRHTNKDCATVMLKWKDEKHLRNNHQERVPKK